jgi:hypothetical protein
MWFANRLAGANLKGLVLVGKLLKSGRQKKMPRNPVDRLQNFFIHDSESPQLINHLPSLAFVPVFVFHLGLKLIHQWASF